MVLAEYVNSTAGLGYEVLTAAANFNTDRIFVAVLVISGIGMIV